MNTSNGMGLGSRGEAIFDRLVSQYFEKIACWIPILCELNPRMDLIIPGWKRVWNNDMRSYFSLLVGFRCSQPTCERLWGRLWCLLLPRWNVYIWSGCRDGAWTTYVFLVWSGFQGFPECAGGFNHLKVSTGVLLHVVSGVPHNVFWCGFQGFHTMYDTCNPISREIELRGVFW